jgi:hypothetical protein
MLKENRCLEHLLPEILTEDHKRRVEYWENQIDYCKYYRIDRKMAEFQYDIMFAPIMRFLEKVRELQIIEKNKVINGAPNRHWSPSDAYDSFFSFFIRYALFGNEICGRYAIRCPNGVTRGLPVIHSCALYNWAPFMRVYNRRKNEIQKLVICYLE